MANMSYCRFQNPSLDLQDCIDYLTRAVCDEIDENEECTLDQLSSEENNAMISLYEQAQALLDLVEDSDTLKEFLKR